MRSILEIRSPSNGTGWADSWTFSGADDRALRDCLEGLEAYATEPPLGRRAPDRWRAAMLFSDHERSVSLGIGAAPREHLRAWTADGALQLAAVLPDRLGDLRDAIIERFAPGTA